MTLDVPYIVYEACRYEAPGSGQETQSSNDGTQNASSHCSTEPSIPAGGSIMKCVECDEEPKTGEEVYVVEDKVIIVAIAHKECLDKKFLGKTMKWPNWLKDK